MKILCTVLLLLISFINVHSQNEYKGEYEQIAVNYFFENIIDSVTKYEKVKYFIYDRKIQDRRSSFWFFSCINIPANFDEPNEVGKIRLLVSKKERVKKHFTLLRRISSSPRTRRIIYVYQADPVNENEMAVMIQSSGYYIDDYFTIAIDVKSKKVIRYCVHTRDT